jgi:HSP20 family protein
MSHVCYASNPLLTPWTPFETITDEFAKTLGWVPSVDVHENENAYTFEVDVPGLNKEDLHIEAEGNRVTIRGERKQAEETVAGARRRTERRYGKFERSFEVYDGFEADKVAARLENGVLYVTLPKREDAKPKQIKVNVN